MNQRATVYKISRSWLWKRQHILEHGRCGSEDIAVDTKVTVVRLEDQLSVFKPKAQNSGGVRMRLVVPHECTRKKVVLTMRQMNVFLLRVI
jgi:hypothetical protein